MIKKKYFAILMVLVVATTGFSQNGKGLLQLQSDSLYDLHVAFNLSIRFDPALPFAEQALSQIPELQDIASQYAFTLEKAIPIPEAKLLEMERNAKIISGDDSSVKQLRNVFTVHIQDPTNSRLYSLSKKLKSLSQVVYCDLTLPGPVKPPGDILPVTDDFEASQAYIAQNPGVDMQYAWNMGLIGSGIRVRDVEYGFNKNHEEFNELSGVFLAPGMTVAALADESYTEHGTASLGIVCADKGSYGVSGLAYGVQEIVLFPEWQQSGYSRNYAVSQAIANSTVGDVIMYEMQARGEEGGYVPAEFTYTIWNLTKAATDAGMIMVAASGNGNQDLDSEYYTDYNSRGNSGAIIVGAGTPDIQHSKISYSTFGSRVDVQGWGSNVLTTGFGDWATINLDYNQRYALFNGTSSALAIVASCVAVLQAYYHDLTGNYLTSIQMRNILKETGIPQGSGGNIGPLPDMHAAINAVALLQTINSGNLAFSVFPNPTANTVNITAGNLSTAAKVQVFNAMGQMVLQQTISDNQAINVGSLQPGLYILKLSDKGKSAIKKIVKTN